MESTFAQSVVGHERRRHRRLQLEALGLAITVRATMSGERFSARLVDVSLGGCCIALRAAEAGILQDNGACLCALPVGLADYPLSYAAAVVARRGAEDAPVHLVHLCFNGVSLHSGHLLARWMARLACDVRAVEAGARMAPGVGRGAASHGHNRWRVPGGDYTARVRLVRA